MPTINGSTPLYTSGHSSVNDNTSLFAKGHIPVTNNASMYIWGHIPSVRTTPLFLQQNDLWTETNSFVSLHTWAGTPGVYNADASMSLFIENTTDRTRGITLYMCNTEPWLTSSVERTLFVAGPSIAGTVLSGNMPMVLMNTNEGAIEETTLYVKGEGLWPGYITDNKAMTLFINRPNIAVGMNLFCKAIDTYSNTYIPLVVLGGYLENENTTLVIPEVVYGKPNTYVSCFIEGAVAISDAVPLALPNVTPNYGNSFISLHTQSGIHPNESIDLYVDGVYSYNGNTTLVVPAVYGEDTSSIQMFVSGY